MEEDEKPINCHKCGRFVKQNEWINENSGEQLELECSNCGVIARY